MKFLPIPLHVAMAVVFVWLHHWMNTEKFKYQIYLGFYSQVTDGSSDHQTLSDAQRAL